jgi:hypothetical protein
MNSFDGLWMDDENVISHTSLEQLSCERECSNYLCLSTERLARLQASNVLDEDSNIKLARDKHIEYLYTGLYRLQAGFVSLDARYVRMHT